MSGDGLRNFVLGTIEIIRVVERQGAFGPTAALIPDVPAQVWKDSQSWLAPDHWSPADDMAVGAVQTWVLRSGGRTVLVDTGVGDGRERPDSPLFHHWKGDLLGRLAKAGVHPEDVDVVVNTHIHGDHVGGNTTKVDGQWVPAFPNAEYLIPAADDFHFGPLNDYANGARRDDRLIYEDSIAPVHRAGQVVLWEGMHRIDEQLTLEAAPGHTPGSAVLRLVSEDDRAVFVGDLVHSPVQLLSPSCNSCFCHDPRQAVRSRRAILDRADIEQELVVPAHFAGPGAMRVRGDGDGYAVDRWAGDIEGGPPIANA